MERLAAGTVVLDRYTLIAPSQLDACYGAVAVACDQRFGREVDLVMSPRPVGTTGGDLWLQRAESVAVLQHATLPQVLDMGFHEGYGLLVYRHAAGRLLSDIPIMELRSWTYRQALHLVAQLATALGLAHTYGLAHGSFSARSVLVEQEGGATILDLVWPRRQAAVDRENVALKLSQGLSPDPGADVAALGEMLWHLTTSIGLGAGSQLKTAVYDVIRRATTLDARARYVDGNALAQAIRRLLEMPQAEALVSIPQPRPVSSPPRAAVAAAPRYRTPPSRRTHRRQSALAPIAMGLAIALFPLADAIAHATMNRMPPFGNFQMHGDDNWRLRHEWPDNDSGQSWPTIRFSKPDGSSTIRMAPPDGSSP
jgi:hypothetical protein